eukprot:scaffold39007_cov58-Phaeocystis_antarctica.AAC.2
MRSSAPRCSRCTRCTANPNPNPNPNPSPNPNPNPNPADLIKALALASTLTLAPSLLLTLTRASASTRRTSPRWRRSPRTPEGHGPATDRQRLRRTVQTGGQMDRQRSTDMRSGFGRTEQTDGQMDRWTDRQADLKTRGAAAAVPEEPASGRLTSRVHHAGRASRAHGHWRSHAGRRPVAELSHAGSHAMERARPPTAAHGPY